MEWIDLLLLSLNPCGIKRSARSVLAWRAQATIARRRIFENRRSALFTWHSNHGVNISTERPANPRRKWKPEIKEERYPPLDGAPRSGLAAWLTKNCRHQSTSTPHKRPGLQKFVLEIDALVLGHVLLRS